MSDDNGSARAYPEDWLALPIPEICARLRCSPATVSRWRRGENRPSPAYRRAIEAEFGAPEGADS